MKHIAVIGAGAFGGWTAYHLRKRGYRVTLIDAWGPGHSRSSSGGETRLIRCVYGGDDLYIDWAHNAMDQWKAFEKDYETNIYTPSGMLWLFKNQNLYLSKTLPHARQLGIYLEELSIPQARQRYPHISFDDLKYVYYEKEGGHLSARKACGKMVFEFQMEGGEYILDEVKPEFNGNGEIKVLNTRSGRGIRADHYVFACGPWMKSLFPEVLGNVLNISRQEVGFFGLPPGTQYYELDMPVWVEFAEEVWYGAPSIQFRGLKVGVDTRDRELDPTNDHRIPNADKIFQYQQYILKRFPHMQPAPLVEGRVCQYTNTPTGHFIIDQHPSFSNLWLVGGGSGHGFKMGPAVGEHVANLLEGKDSIKPIFSLQSHQVSGVALSQLAEGNNH